MNRFDYLSPADVSGVGEVLTGMDGALPLAGGMSLIPSLKMRLSAPTALVDLAGVPGLATISEDGDGVKIGAMARHVAVADSALIQARLPALAELAGQIGDPQVRNRGTLGGSVANNDPAADYPAALLALGATVLTNRRSIAASDFFTGMFSTALLPGEFITAISFPQPQAAAYEKFRSPASRYALTGVFVARTTAGVRVAVTGAAACVFRADIIEAALTERFAVESLDSLRYPYEGLLSDMHGDAQYRGHLIGLLARRAVAQILTGNRSH